MDMTIIREVIKRYDGVPSNMLTAAQRTAIALLSEVDRLAAREGEADRLRKGMESAYSIWSHAQEDCSVADRMADIINKTLQGEAKHV